MRFFIALGIVILVGIYAPWFGVMFFMGLLTLFTFLNSIFYASGGAFKLSILFLLMTFAAGSLGFDQAYEDAQSIVEEQYE